ncbi:MAG TPA: O-antigen ligase family protein, partial [Ktedonobacteraceae bacterium]|nr:O-antigen ligase family protein [Ktedonobacteraceae bacterium]
QIFASYLSQGSISAINYSLKLYSVPIGVIFASVGRAVLPYLSRQAAIKDMKAFKETLRLYVWAVGIGSMILSAFMIILAHPIVRILFQHGAFTPADTNATSITLIGFLIGLTPMGVGFVLVKAFSALGKTHVLLYVTLFSIFANALFDYIFARWWQSFGIALSTSAVYFCTAVIVLVTLHRTIGNIHLFSPPSEIHKVILKLSLGRYYSRWIIWRRKITQFFNIPEHTRQSIIRFILAIVVFIGGVGGVILNDLTALKAAFGSILILALLRFRLLLLLIWIMIDVFIGSSVSFFNGSNFDSGLTLPVVLLMFYFPVKQTFKRMPALALLLIYLFWVLASIFVSAISIGAFLISWFIFLDFVAVSVLTINVLTTQRRLTLVVDTILLLSMIIAVYGIYGYITKQNGIPDAQIPSLFRISSVFSQTPTALAYFLTVVIPLSFYRTTTLGGFKRIFGWVITVLLLGTLVLTFSRGAFIAIAVSILILIIFLPSRKMRFGMISGIVVFGALVAAVVTVGNIPVFSRFFNTDISTLNGRTYLWNAIIAHFDPTHVLGNGLNASDALLTALNIGNGGGVIATAPHNLFLGTLYDHGVVGLLLLTLTFIVQAASLINGIRKTT